MHTRTDLVYLCARPLGRASALVFLFAAGLAAALTEPPPFMRQASAAQLPPGVISMLYEDDDRLAGRYLLWLRVERLQ